MEQLSNLENLFANKNLFNQNQDFNSADDSGYDFDRLPEDSTQFLTDFDVDLENEILKNPDADFFERTNENSRCDDIVLEFSLDSLIWCIMVVLVFFVLLHFYNTLSYICRLKNHYQKVKIVPAKKCKQKLAIKNCETDYEKLPIVDDQKEFIKFIRPVYKEHVITVVPEEKEGELV